MSSSPQFRPYPEVGKFLDKTTDFISSLHSWGLCTLAADLTGEDLRSRGVEVSTPNFSTKCEFESREISKNLSYFSRLFQQLFQQICCSTWYKVWVKLCTNAYWFQSFALIIISHWPNKTECREITPALVLISSQSPITLSGLHYISGNSPWSLHNCVSLYGYTYSHKL